MPSPLLLYQETEELLETIILNKSLYKAESLEGPKFVVFSHPTGTEFLKSRCQRERAIVEATTMGLPTIENLEKLIIDKHLKDVKSSNKITRIIIAHFKKATTTNCNNCVINVVPGCCFELKKARVPDTETDFIKALKLNTFCLIIRSIIHRKRNDLFLSLFPGYPLKVRIIIIDNNRR